MNSTLVVKAWPFPTIEMFGMQCCEQVTRSKNKWKCTLKDGIMHLNNRDILFVKVGIVGKSYAFWVGSIFHFIYFLLSSSFVNL